MKQKNKIRFLLVAVLAGVSVMGYAQGKWCIGAQNPYEIVQVTAPSDVGATFHWTKDGKEISGATLASLTLPTDLPEGKYTYIRYATKPDCPDAVASNAFTVEVLTCGDIQSGAAIGTKGTFEDARDKKVYKIVKMPDGKVWMAENLNYQKDLKFNAKAEEAKGELFTFAGSGVPAIGSFWCPALAGTGGSVTTSQNTCNVYGALYTWETAMSENGLGSGEWNENNVSDYYLSGAVTPPDNNCAGASGRGICPAGYHVPTDLEWAEMLEEIETEGYTTQNDFGWKGTNAGDMLRTNSTFLGTDPGNGAWVNTTNIGSNTTGFSAIPSGARNSTGIYFEGRSGYAFFWTSSVVALDRSIMRLVYGKLSSVKRDAFSRSYGLSVRCVRN
jgi:uncharacterized protein (TIGR02145 family)